LHDLIGRAITIRGDMNVVVSGHDAFSMTDDDVVRSGATAGGGVAASGAGRAAVGVGVAAAATLFGRRGLGVVLTKHS
jgi:hypothetical protein